MAGQPFTISPALTGISLAYTNGAYIADQVMPRLSPFAQSVYKFLRYDFAQGLTVPETRVGRKSAPAEVEFGVTEDSGQTQPYGLDDPVPSTDTRDAPAGYDPVDRATTGLTDLLLLARERRVATIAQSAATYPAGHVETLSGTDKWSDDASDPIGQISDAMDAMPMRPSLLVLGRPAWSALRRHPAIVSAVNRSSGDKGRATVAEAAELLEVDRIVIGESWINAARRGQTPERVRVWGAHASLLYQPAGGISMVQDITWGWTAQTAAPGMPGVARFAGTMPDSSIGVHGGTRVRVGEEVEERVVAPDLGYLFRDVV
ncbi:major capsid protein [Tistrella bauzanensis]|uniref:major capsid protein n=1 Tax=Tistrella TaxID=171436 RepID=UPI0031F671BA